MDTPTDTDTNWSLIAALGAALGASACCTIPLALVSLGIGGAWVGSLTALAPYRWFFVALAVSALVYAGYNEWRMSRPDCECESALTPAVRRSLLGVGALAVLAIVASPWLIAPSPGVATDRVRAAAKEPSTPASFRQVVLTVDGMTCKACPVTVRRALEGIDGVYSAEVTYEPPEAFVRLDSEEVAVEDLTSATERAGFPSRQQSSP